MKNRIGEIKKSNKCGLMKIIEYNSTKDIKVKFETGSVVKTQYSNFKKGTVKDPLLTSIFEIGYVGIGKYKPSINCKHTIEYINWYNMLKRCYDSYSINKRLTYQNVIVCKEWLNFQNFAEWFNKNYYQIPGKIMNLDKDLIKKKNKIYCPEFCSFVSQSINTLLIKCDKSRGNLPIGVSFDKNRNKYRSNLSINGKNKHLGRFSTSLEAFNAYKIAKEEYIKIIANKYKQYLPKKVYSCLMIYNVEITD